MASKITMFELRPDGPLVGSGCDCPCGDCECRGCACSDCECGESATTTDDSDAEGDSCPGRSAGLAVGVALIALAAIAVVLAVARRRSPESAVAVDAPE